MCDTSIPSPLDKISDWEAWYPTSQEKVSVKHNSTIATEAIMLCFVLINAKIQPINDAGSTKSTVGRGGFLRVYDQQWTNFEISILSNIYYL